MVPSVDIDCEERSLWTVVAAASSEKMSCASTFTLPDVATIATSTAVGYSVSRADLTAAESKVLRSPETVKTCRTR